MIEIKTAESRLHLERAPALSVHDTEFLTTRAKTAIAFVEKWGMVAAEPDGEDSAGRAKLALSSSVRVVDRACEMAELLFDQMEKRNWIKQLPTISDIEKRYAPEVPEKIS